MRAALATLPLDGLYGIEVTSGRTDVIEDRGNVRLLQTRPIIASELYQVKCAFGPSGTDGNSWRIRWTAGDAALRDIRISRNHVIYH